MQEISVMTSRTSVRPSARTDCRDGGGEARQPLGTGAFRAIFLGGKSLSSIAFGNQCFSGGKSY